jgi:hypothetical protein
MIHLQETLDNLSRCELAKTHLVVVLAMEEREEQGANKAKMLTQR